jgi:hypothetical protein
MIPYLLQRVRLASRAMGPSTPSAEKPMPIDAALNRAARRLHSAALPKKPS